MPLNFLEMPFKFHDTDKGFRHNKREGGGGGFGSREEGSGEGQEVQAPVSHSANNSLTLDWD